MDVAVAVVAPEDVAVAVEAPVDAAVADASMAVVDRLGHRVNSSVAHKLRVDATNLVREDLSENF